MNTDDQAELSPVSISTVLVESRNALIARGKFGALYMDFYLHLMQHELKLGDGLDGILKRGVTAVALHAATRPPDEVTAWTFHCQDPLLNLFVASNNPDSSVSGRLFTDQVKEDNKNLFYSQVARGAASPRQSVVEVEGSDVFAAVETFYAQSQQLPVRLFDLGGEDEFAMVVAMPDCDVAWLRELNEERVLSVTEHESVKALATRDYRFDCGCSLPRIVRSLLALRRADAEDLFGDDDALIITCPRCGARYAATRETLDELTGQSENR